MTTISATWYNLAENTKPELNVKKAKKRSAWSWVHQVMIGQKITKKSKIGQICSCKRIVRLSEFLVGEKQRFPKRFTSEISRIVLGIANWPKQERWTSQPHFVALCWDVAENLIGIDGQNFFNLIWGNSHKPIFMKNDFCWHVQMAKVR